MLKKVFLIAIVLLSYVGLKAQNEVGGYLLTSNTIIYNPQDVEEDFYSNRFTMSRGVAINYIHFFKGKKDTRKHSRYGYRFDLIYTGHSQKWTANYKTGKGQTAQHKGQIRLDYIKFNPLFEVSHPYSKHLSLIMFTGPQLSYLIDNDGGLMAYRIGATSDYFDLPVQNRGYYKSFTVDAVLGIGVDYEFTKWLNLTAGLRGDFGLTTSDRPSIEIGETTLRRYNLERERGGSRNIAFSIFGGVEYILHRPEHAKTRF